MSAPTTTTLCCPICGRPLAVSDGRQLRLAGVWIERLVTLHCAARACRGYVVWRPVYRMSEQSTPRDIVSS